ncbi:hypothetical protein Mhypo_03512 [Meiothermus hypogaeus]|uniref:Uncharacterized protein n=1 Tax=Meiothermus hypogaeus TaxID=884155 RepID=A0ABX9MGX7_9DEIN|nr:hypothetical protein Mhypo_03512 [Meiothermus hypogaeus]
MGGFALEHSQGHAQVVYQVFEDPPVHPAVGLRLNDMGWEVVGQVVPLGTGSDHPTQGAPHFAQVVLALGSL